jgi:hypothetical protein
MPNARDFQTSTDGPFIPVGHRMELPGLPEMAAPSGRHSDRVRLVKDVMRVGQWHYNNDDGTKGVFNCSLESLHEMARNFDSYQAAGNASNFIWNHSDDARDQIAPVDQMLVANGRLYAVGYFSKEQAEEMKNPARKVSLRVAPPGFSDGNGTEYNSLPLHVAVVETPVVSGQGAFVELSNKQARQFLLTGKRPKDFAMDFEGIKGLLNSLFSSMGVELVIPEHVVDQETFEQWVMSAIAIVAPTEAVEAPDATQEGDPVLTEEITAEPQAGDAAPVAAEMSNIIKAAFGPINKQLVNLSNQVKSLQGDKARDKATAYNEKLNSLGAAGLPGSEVTRLKGLGAKFGFDLSLLDGAENHKSVRNFGSVSKSHRNGSAPKANGTRMSDSDVEELLKNRGVDAGKMPRSAR